jgi:hypothetical protein
MKNTIIIFFFTLICFYLQAQIGGTGTYSFLNLPTSAHESACGGINISTYTNEPAFVLQNPSLLSDSINNIAFLSTTKLFADIYYGTCGYSFKNKKIGNIFVGFIYLNYGDFDKYDELGINYGKFYASEYMLNIGFARNFNSDSLFAYGFNIKPVFSQLEKYSSLGLVFDAGLRYHNPQNLWTLALVIKNVGMQIKNYTPNQQEPINYNFIFGITKKLKHAPLRISVTLNHLNNWHLSDFDFQKNNQQGYYSDTSKTYTKFQKNLEEFIRHIIVSGDIVFSKNFYVSIGYNFQRRKELSITPRLSTVGISWGFGFKLYRFQLHFARVNYHLAGSTNTITISSNIKDWFK